MKRTNNVFLRRLTTALMFSALPALSHAVAFDIGWTGANGYTMTGMFSYDNLLINTGAIDETDIDTLMIEVFQNNVSQGTWDLADGLGAGAGVFNFNFDTTTEAFVVGGLANQSAGQIWNFNANPGVGFVSGTPMQAVSVNGISLLGLTPTANTTLIATPAVPEPSTVLLFGAGMLGLLGHRLSSTAKRSSSNI